MTPASASSVVVAKLGQKVAVRALPVRCGFDIGFKHLRPAFGFQDALGDFADDDAVELVHADAHAFAGGRALLELP